MGEFSAAAHAAGLRVVWYYPTLEVLTDNGANLAHTMFKDHPDWIQVGLDGSPNVFYGGGGRVFWVAPGTESAWMSPNSGYRPYYMKRVKQIAATGIDGLWLDVPLLNDIAVTWTDFHPSATAQFTSDTGLEPPQTQDWTDPVWRRWISWRHQQISDFLSDVALAGQSVNPKFTTITETVTMDYSAGTSIALDGADLKYLDGVTHIWEIDVLSDSNAMRNSLEDDWVSLIAMNKFARAASGNKPSWVFTYGRQSDDAELVMAEALAARNNPFELKIPEMTSTVGADYRTRMFGWIKDNAPYLFAAKSGSQVAVLYSSPSRDFVDQANDAGNFYLALQNEHPVELNWAYTLYLDTDSSAMTGFALFSIGADYVLQGRSLYLPLRRKRSGLEVDPRGRCNRSRTLLCTLQEPELEHEIVVRMRPRDTFSVEVELQYLGRAKPRVVVEPLPEE